MVWKLTRPATSTNSHKDVSSGAASSPHSRRKTRACWASSLSHEGTKVTQRHKDSSSCLRVTFVPLCETAFLVTAFVSRIAIDQLREATLLPILSLLLIEKRQVVLIKPLEELIPANLLKRALTREPRIIDPQQPGAVFALRVLHPRRMPTSVFHPATNLVVIGRYF